MAGRSSQSSLARLEARGGSKRRTLGGRCDIATNPLNPGSYLERHQLEFKILEPAGAGYNNHVFMSEHYVLRVSRSNSYASHAREARLASAAIKLGVKTAHCIAFEQDYSIWERLNGIRSNRDTSPGQLWEALLDDLEKLHAHPLEPAPEDLPAQWVSHEFLLESTQNAANWSPSERKTLERILTTKHSILHNTFIHGDAWQDNVLEHDGAYAGLIDWTGAGWSSLEFECSRLENPALEIGLKRWELKLDVELVRKMRLELLLRVGTMRHVEWAAVREIVAHFK